jgi:hypothetical protein
LELPVVGSSTEQYYGFWNFKSGVVERFRRRYMLYIVTAEIQTANVAYFQKRIQLPGFSAYPDGSPSQLIQVGGILLTYADDFNILGVNVYAIKENEEALVVAIKEMGLEVNAD